ncbi:MAG: TRAP transporter small permease [Comamonas sp.]
MGWTARWTPSPGCRARSAASRCWPRRCWSRPRSWPACCGTQIPAADDFAAWSMAATVFLSLPYTLRQGAHIRVTLALQVLPPRAKQLCEVLSTVAALVLVGWAAKHCTLFVHESFVGNELSQGMVILPMWVPQLSMPIGMWGMFVMLLGRLVCALRGDYWTEEGHG